MVTLLLRNVPDDLYQRLRETAAAHHRSVAQEAIVTLKGALVSQPLVVPKPSWEEFASEMKEFWERLPADNRTPDEIIGYDEHGLPS